MFDDNAYNAELGYKQTLSADEATIVDRLLYHGRLGGDLVDLQDAPMFFYANGDYSSVFSEHIFLNGDETYKVAAGAEDDSSFYDAYLAHAPVVFLCRVTIDNPIILDMARLLAIANELGIPESDHESFVADFEDSASANREQVFAWVQSQGYNGAVIVNDLTPVVAGGDWGFKPSYVAFDPKNQLRFAFDHQSFEAAQETRRASRPRM